MGCKPAGLYLEQPVQWYSTGDEDFFWVSGKGEKLPSEVL